MNQDSTQFDPKESFKRAFEAHRSGKLDDAEGIYREILSHQPENPHAIHLLGVIALQQGRADEARELIEAAIKREDSHALFHNNLGEAYRVLGQLEQAEKFFLAALERQPGYPQALTNLGITLHQLGRHHEAVSRLKQALELTGPSADGLSNLGLAQFAAGALDDAIATLRQAVDFDPQHGEANNNLGTALLEKGEVEAAAFVLEEAVRLQPRAADAWSNLARARLGQSEFGAAEECARKAVALAPDQSRYHTALGLVMDQARRPQEAAAAFRRALEMDPEQAMPHYLLGTVLMRVGQFEAAEALLGRAIELNPKLTIAHEALSHISRYGSEALADIERLEQLAKSSELSAPARISLEFALAKMLDDCGEYDRAYIHLETANALTKQQLRFDPEDLNQILEDTKRTVDRALIERKVRSGSDSALPILIVGMPGSGTTLAEQILASHPKVSGGGEIGYLSAAARGQARETGVTYPACLGMLTETAVGALAQNYLERLEQARDGQRFVTDRGPYDFVHLGLFSILFPKGCVVHCLRDPVDTCFSLYKQHFLSGSAFAYGLEDIADYYHFYRQMMAHWHSVLPTPIFHLRYEALAEEQERVTRELLEHCGLPFDEACLRPHETQREIRSPSFWQVRQPLYRSSVGKSQRYQKHLHLLIEALERCGYESSTS